MEHYLQYGQLAAWPYLRVIRYMLRLEISLDEGVEQLKSRIEDLGPDFDDSDDLDSIASCSTSNAMALSKVSRTVRFVTPSRQLESLQKKLASMELENAVLRQEVQDLRMRLSGQNTPDGDTMSEEKKSEEKAGPPSAALSEGNVFNLVRGLATFTP